MKLDCDKSQKKISINLKIEENYIRVVYRKATIEYG